MQSRTDSLMESLTNVAVGFSINLVANIIILPLVLGVPVNLGELGFIGLLYTVISVARSYTLRRIFNGRSIWQAIKDRFGRHDNEAMLDPRGSLRRAGLARKRVQSVIGKA